MVKWQQAADTLRNSFLLKFVVLILRRNWIFCRNQCHWCRFFLHIIHSESDSSPQRFFSAYKLVLIDSLVTDCWKICNETARYIVAPANYHIIVNANKSETFQCFFCCFFFFSCSETTIIFIYCFEMYSDVKCTIHISIEQWPTIIVIHSEINPKTTFLISKKKKKNFFHQQIGHWFPKKKPKTNLAKFNGPICIGYFDHNRIHTRCK